MRSACWLSLLSARSRRLGSWQLPHAPPGHDSVIGTPVEGALAFVEFVVYRGEQAYPEFLITYRIAGDENQGTRDTRSTVDHD